MRRNFAKLATFTLTLIIITAGMASAAPGGFGGHNAGIRGMGVPPAVHGANFAGGHASGVSCQPFRPGSYRPCGPGFRPAPFHPCGPGFRPVHPAYHPFGPGFRPYRTGFIPRPFIHNYYRPVVPYFIAPSNSFRQTYGYVVPGFYPSTGYVVNTCAPVATTTTVVCDNRSRSDIIGEQLGLMMVGAMTNLIFNEINRDSCGWHGWRRHW